MSSHAEMRRARIADARRRLSSCMALMFLTGFTFAQDRPLEDPMRPYVPAPGTRTEIEDAPRVSAILISESRRVAVIDGRSYRVGDRFNGARITRIDAKSVHLRRDDRDFVMELTVRRQPAGDP